MITAFSPFVDEQQAAQTEANLHESKLVTKIVRLGADMPVTASSTMKFIADNAGENPYILLYTKTNTLVPGYLALERLVRLAEDSGAGMLYSDYYTVVDGVQKNAPVIDYQAGSLRDDFNFGSLLFFRTADFRIAAEGIDRDYKAAGL